MNSLSFARGVRSPFQLSPTTKASPLFRNNESARQAHFPFQLPSYSKYLSLLSFSASSQHARKSRRDRWSLCQTLWQVSLALKNQGINRASLSSRAELRCLLWSSCRCIACAVPVTLTATTMDNNFSCGTNGHHYPTQSLYYLVTVSDQKDRLVNTKCLLAYLTHNCNTRVQESLFIPILLERYRSWCFQTGSRCINDFVCEPRICDHSLKMFLRKRPWNRVV